MSNLDDRLYSFIFTWEILNYSLCDKENGEHIASPVFAADHLNGNKWQIKFYPKGEKDLLEYVSIYLTMLECDKQNENIVVDDKVELIGGSGEVFETHISQLCIFSKTKSRIWRKFCLIEELQNLMHNSWEHTLTLRYYFRKRFCTRQFQETPTIATAVTIIGTYRCCGHWKACYPNLTIYPESKTFFFPDNSSIKLELTSSKDDILLTCKTDELKLFPGIVKSRISLLDTNRTKRYIQNATFLLTRKNNSWTYPPIIKISEFKENESIFLRDRVLSLLCEFSVPSGSKLKENLRYRQRYHFNLDNIVDVSPLIFDYQDLYLSKIYCDIVLRTGGEEFFVHKSVLAAKSTVFTVMFQHKMLESETGIIDMTGTDKEVLSSFLLYMYSGEFDEMDQNKALHLLMMGDKYEIAPLIEKCSSFLTFILSMTNFYQILLTADMIEVKGLKNNVIKYITAHSAKILNTVEWEEFMENHFQLGIEVLRHISIEFGKY